DGPVRAPLGYDQGAGSDPHTRQATDRLVMTRRRARTSYRLGTLGTNLRREVAHPLDRSRAGRRHGVVRRHDAAHCEPCHGCKDGTGRRDQWRRDEGGTDADGEPTAPTAENVIEKSHGNPPSVGPCTAARRTRQSPATDLRGAGVVSSGYVARFWVTSPRPAPPSARTSATRSDTCSTASAPSMRARSDAARVARTISLAIGRMRVPTDDDSGPLEVDASAKRPRIPAPKPMSMPASVLSKNAMPPP